MLPYCRTQGIGLLCFGCLAGGFLSDRWLGKPVPNPAAPETWSLQKYYRYIEVWGGWHLLQELLQVLREVADRHEASIANVALRWVLQQKGVASVIVGCRLGHSEHRSDTERTLQFELSEVDQSAIEAVLARSNSIPGDCGDEYRRPPFLTASGDLSHHLASLPQQCTASPYPLAGPATGQCVNTNTTWEDIASFSRAVRRGDHIWVSGTTATHEGQCVGGGDAASQACVVLDKIESSIKALGGTLQDVVRTRIYVRHLEDWEAVARIHGERFAGICPANTLVSAGLVGEEYLVEMEAEAMVARHPNGEVSG